MILNVDGTRNQIDGFFCKDKKSLNICMVDEILSKKISAQERLKTIIINHCSNPLDNNRLIEIMVKIVLIYMLFNYFSYNLI